MIVHQMLLTLLFPLIVVAYAMIAALFAGAGLIVIAAIHHIIRLLKAAKQQELLLGTDGETSISYSGFAS
jgi:hypothetical protein